MDGGTRRIAGREEPCLFLMAKCIFGRVGAGLAVGYERGKIRFLDGKTGRFAAPAAVAVRHAGALAAH